jgi:hypothetical protein
MSAEKPEPPEIAWLAVRSPISFRLSWLAWEDLRLPIDRDEADHFDPGPPSLYPGLGKQSNGLPGMNITLVSFREFDSARAHMPDDTYAYNNVVFTSVREDRITTVFTLPIFHSEPPIIQRGYFEDHIDATAENKARLDRLGDDIGVFRALARPILISHVREAARNGMAQHILRHPVQHAASVNRYNKPAEFANEIVVPAVEKLFPEPGQEIAEAA